MKTTITTLILICFAFAATSQVTYRMEAPYDITAKAVIEYPEGFTEIDRTYIVSQAFMGDALGGYPPKSIVRIEKYSSLNGVTLVDLKMTLYRLPYGQYITAKVVDDPETRTLIVTLDSGELGFFSAFPRAPEWIFTPDKIAGRAKFYENKKGEQTKHGLVPAFETLLDNITTNINYYIQNFKN